MCRSIAHSDEYVGEGVRELTNPKLAGEGFLSRRPSHVFADRWPPSVASWVSDGTGRRSTSCVIVKDSLTTVSTGTQTEDF